MSQARSFITNIEITFNITLPPQPDPVETTQEEKFAKKEKSHSLARIISSVLSKYFHVIGNIIKEESLDKCQI